MKPSKNSEKRRKFYETKGLKRFLNSSTPSIISTIAGFSFAVGTITVATQEALPELQKVIKELFEPTSDLPQDIISNTYASIQIFADSSSNQANSVNILSIVNLIIMASLGIAFIWSLAITLHSNDKEKVETANGTNNLILGFFIGAGKSYIGIE